MTNITKRAASCAAIPHDHEGGRALSKTFSDIGTGGLFTDGVKTVLSQNGFNFKKARAQAWGLYTNPAWLRANAFGMRNDRNEAGFCRSLLLKKRGRRLGGRAWISGHEAFGLRAFQ